MLARLYTCLPVWFMLITGCSSKPIQLSYYTLYHSPAQNQVVRAEQVKKHIQVSHIRLAEYLQQANLVMQSDKHKLLFSKQHMWAENLQVGIEKALLDSLNGQSSDVLYSGPSEPTRTSCDYELTIHFEHLLPTMQSEVIASGQYWLRDTSNNEVLLQQRFHMLEALDQDGYPHAIAKMRNLIDQLAISIHQQI